MDERNSGFSDDFGNKLSLDDGEQYSPKASPFGSPDNENGFSFGAAGGDQESDTIDSIPTDFSEDIFRLAHQWIIDCY